MDFTRGLVYLSSYLAKDDQKDLISAVDAFQKAIRQAEQGQPFEGQEVLYVFAATTYRLQNNLEKSMYNIEQALRLNPQYARAYIARGSIYYEQSAQADEEDKLRQALVEYNNALIAEDQPEGAYIREKAHLGIGNVYTALADITQKTELYAQAIQAFQESVSQYEKTHNRQLQEIAGVGYYGLGIAYESQKNFAQARETYQQCVALTEQAEMKAECLFGIGLAYEMQGDYTQGIAAYQQCVALAIQSRWKPICFKGLGDVYAKQANRPKAREAYQQCMNLTDDVVLKDDCSARLSVNN